MNSNARPNSGSAQTTAAERPLRVVEDFEPFPVDALPEPVRGFVASGAEAIGCDPSYVALPILSGLAAAIGNTRQLRLKRTWAAPACVWAVVVGESGTAKTPAIRLAMRPQHNRQRRAFADHAAAMAKYREAKANWEREMAKRKKSREQEAVAAPEEPLLPELERFIVSDVTVEALATLLSTNPQGLLLNRDELSGWIGSFDRYAGGKGGGDESHWLSMHSGESMSVDRKTGDFRTIYVPKALVSICGGIQPGVLFRALGTAHRESGLSARLLLAWPPRKARCWTEADIDPRVERGIERVFDRLFELSLAKDVDGGPRPTDIHLTSEAKRLWIVFFNRNAAEQVDLGSEMAAVWSKMEEYAPRLALIIHLARWAACDSTLESDDHVDVQSMEAGICLTNWLKNEVQRVYLMLGESDEARDDRRLVEWIERKGGAVTARQVQGGCRWLRESGEAEAALKRLVEAERGSWELTPRGTVGQPTRVFRLAKPVCVNGNAQIAVENTGSVDVDEPISPETAPIDDGWGDL